MFDQEIEQCRVIAVSMEFALRQHVASATHPLS